MKACHANPSPDSIRRTTSPVKISLREGLRPGSEKNTMALTRFFCAALNVTHGERLAWQERKAESFLLYPVALRF